MEESDPSYKGQSGYNAAMLAIYDVWVLKFMTKAVWKVPVAQGVDSYRQHMGHRHLDVGPGTGYFIEKANPPRDTKITLLDPNQTVLRHVAKRLEERHPITVEADVMKPLPVDGRYDSAALSFVRHCLRGPEGNKAVAVRNIADVLSPEGVLFGGTVLGLQSNHTKPARSCEQPTSKGASTTWTTRLRGSSASWRCPSAPWMSTSSVLRPSLPRPGHGPAPRGRQQALACQCMTRDVPMGRFPSVSAIRLRAFPATSACALHCELVKNKTRGWLHVRSRHTFGCTSHEVLRPRIAGPVAGERGT